jgi:SET domain-containing protein
MLEVREAPGKGRGVFARMDIPEGTEIERVPLIIVNEEEVENSILMNYVFVWTKKTVAVALGYGSMYNHSYSPNARYHDGRNHTKVFTAIKDIAAGEEITVNYNGDPENEEKVVFKVIENGSGRVRKVNGANRASNGKAPSATTKTKRKLKVKVKSRTKKAAARK